MGAPFHWRLAARCTAIEPTAQTPIERVRRKDPSGNGYWRCARLPTDRSGRPAFSVTAAAAHPRRRTGATRPKCHPSTGREVEVFSRLVAHEVNGIAFVLADVLDQLRVRKQVEHHRDAPRLPIGFRVV